MGTLYVHCADFSDFKIIKKLSQKYTDNVTFKFTSITIFVLS